MKKHPISHTIRKLGWLTLSTLVLLLAAGCSDGSSAAISGDALYSLPSLGGSGGGGAGPDPRFDLGFPRPALDPFSCDLRAPRWPASMDTL